LILEPLGRNTAAAVGLAAIHIQRRDSGAVMGVFPADHLFREVDPWLEAVEAALAFAADSDHLVTIGLEPLTASPSYGYLHLGGLLNPGPDLPVYTVQRFVEKPTVKIAQTYLESGEYLWNTGTFMWKVTAILDAFAQHLPGHFAGLQEIAASPDSWEVLSRVYPDFENISIDDGVMEKSSNVAAVKAQFERIDLGNLSNLAELFPSDENGNVARGSALVVEGENNLIFDETGSGLTVAFGLDDVMLIRQNDVVLACPKRAAHRIKDLLAELKEQGFEKYL
jgi:mannose-1-phosphate guanylyltransferase